MQHIEMARELGMETVGFLMMAHMIEPAELLEQARIMEAAGAAVRLRRRLGRARMTADDARDARRGAHATALDAETQVGFHAHNNLALGGRQLDGRGRGGRDQVDGCARGLGAGAGNCPTEVLVGRLREAGLRDRRRPDGDDGRRRGRGRADHARGRRSSTATA